MYRLRQYPVVLNQHLVNQSYNHFQEYLSNHRHHHLDLPQGLQCNPLGVRLVAHHHQYPRGLLVQLRRYHLADCC